eukprot:TRINITY_DN22570_c0_g1_i2.p2 TRINITY_DN22570_c0_g1~~TRINITY_DN22570_c0_g1_i2.p2  ORF type:complete len:140 (+),score=15.74 TRINITY_DN22570_c0_g1_i2:142-561(+)
MKCRELPHGLRHFLKDMSKNKRGAHKVFTAAELYDQAVLCPFPTTIDNAIPMRRKRLRSIPTNTVEATSRHMEHRAVLGKVYSSEASVVHKLRGRNSVVCESKSEQNLQRYKSLVRISQKIIRRNKDAGNFLLISSSSQ